MEESGARPDSRIFNSLLTICAKSCSRGLCGIAEGEEILQEMRRRGLPMDRFTYHGLLDILSRDSSLTDRMKRAQLLVLEMEADEKIGRDTVTGNLLLQCARADDNPEAASTVFESLGKSRDSRSYAIMVSMANSNTDVQHLFRRARAEGLRPTIHMYNAALENALARNEADAYWQWRSQIKMYGIYPNSRTKKLDAQVGWKPNSWPSLHRRAFYEPR
jgi:hypothetical protein